MNGTEFIKRAKRYAKRSGQRYLFEPTPGRGSHGRLWIGHRFTTVQRSELKKGVYFAMLKQLAIPKEDF